MKETDLEEKLFTFIKDFGDDFWSLELFLFFCRHPDARFNRTAVIHALTGGQFDTRIALKRLLDKKIVMSTTENGISLYGLTREEPAHSLSTKLLTIDQRQWQVILGHILETRGME